MALPPIRSSTDATMRTLCDLRESLSASGAISSAATGCSPQLLEWQDRPTRPRPPYRSFAAFSQTSRWPGSRTKCHSSTTPIGSTIWKASVGLVSTDPQWRLVLQSRVQQSLKKSRAIVRIDEDSIVGHVRTRKVWLEGERACQCLPRLVNLSK